MNKLVAVPAYFADGEDRLYRYRILPHEGYPEVWANPIDDKSKQFRHFYIGKDGIMRADTGKPADPSSRKAA